ncbi:hypothetical protein VNO78_07500 [Psophocarpus tetragonolobus]|uniref:Late embryogenesis abundant protein LEA-2 subgroup domain-containing protein n=1 Tax=Psophocarpus tetragonolobus TaxID=3891 RepID=A0AAN9T3B9_PSOTE
MACCIQCSKGLKFWCVVTFIVVITLLLVLVVLFFTLLKAKDPNIILDSVKVEGFKFEFPTMELNVSLGIVVTVVNPNHGSFTYDKTTAYVYYGGTLVAEAPLHEDTIPARKHHNISMSMTVFADVTKFKDLPSDYVRGVINFTSTTTLFGKVKLLDLDLFKMKAKSYSTCYISLFLRPHQSINSTCHSHIKL